MTDPKPVDSPRPDGDAPDLDREAKIDELLLAGLEHYFGGRFQEAVNVWGRVLFLDRGHARARAYIERARGALAERQRQAAQLVEEGAAAIDRGDGPAARRLLTSAIESGDPHDLARTHLDRLDRLSAPAQAPPRWRTRPGTSEPVAGTDSEPVRQPGPVRALPIIAAAVVIAAVMLFAASRDWLRPLVARGARPMPAGSSVVLAHEPLPVPRAAEIALARARSLYSGGHVKAALAALDGVPEADPLALDALRLRANLQRTLLEPRAERPAEAADVPAEPAPKPAEAGR
jgi:hypothetical protein